MGRKQKYAWKSLRKEGQGTVIRLIICLLLAIIFWGVNVKEEVAAESGLQISTEVALEETEVTQEGITFSHPAVGAKTEEWERVREKLKTGTEPWNTYMKNWMDSDYAKKSYSIRNQDSSDPTKARYTYKDYTSGFMERVIGPDARAAYTQAVLYYLTGDEDYREKSIAIVRLWSQLDPSLAEWVPDGKIKMSGAMYGMVSAAELLRATNGTCREELKWTPEDTEKFTTNFVDPPMKLYLANEEANNNWMNQYNYALAARIAADIFKNDGADYAKAVEMATVNSSSTKPEGSGALKWVMRKMNEDPLAIKENPDIADDVIQLAEMGRDQAHAGGNIACLMEIAYMLQSQDTRLDPEEGTISSSADAVSFFEFADYRLLRGTNYYLKYNLGYHVKWYPLSLDGSTPYGEIFDHARGRLSGFGLLYYAYIDDEGIKGKLQDENVGKYVKESLEKQPAAYECECYDAWLHLPESAEGMECSFQRERTDPREIENRYTVIEGTVTKETEGEVSYVSMTAKGDGSKIAILDVPNQNDRSGYSTYRFRIRTTAPAVMELFRSESSKPFQSVILPDTNGEWKDFFVDMNIRKVSYAQYIQDIQVVYVRVSGGKETIGFDTLKVNATDNYAPEFGDSKITLRINQDGRLERNIAAQDKDGDPVTYRVIGAPQGVSVSDGRLIWEKAVKGDYDFYVQADDGKSLSVLAVRLEVETDLKAAADKISNAYDSSTAYISTTEKNYLKARESIDALIVSGEKDADVCNRALENLENAVQGLALLNPRMPDGSLDYSQMVTSDLRDGLEIALLDSDAETQTGDLWIQEGKSEAEFTFDFGVDYQVKPVSFSVQGRKYFAGRVGGTHIYGSNDKKRWVRLTVEEIGGAEEMVPLSVSPKYQEQAYRYIKVGSPSRPLNMAEFRIYGERIETANRMDEVSIYSQGGDRTRAVPGEPVAVTFTAREEIKNIAVSVCGQPAEAALKQQGEGKFVYEAAAVLPEQGVEPGYAEFEINYQTMDGAKGKAWKETSDGSSVLVSNDQDYIDVLEMEENGALEILDPSGGKNTEAYIGAIRKLFDGDKETFADVRNSSNNGWVDLIFDFGEEKTGFSRVELLGRQGRPDLLHRINGINIQGSDDKENWTVISKTSAQGTENWQYLEVKDRNKYRFIKITNSTDWYGNLAEVRFYGQQDVETEPSRERIAYFSFDNADQGLAGNGAEADVIGNAVIIEDEQRGKALSLDGTGSCYLNVVKEDGDSLLTGLEEMTISYYSKSAGEGSNWTFYAAPNTNRQGNSPTYIGIIDKIDGLTAERHHGGQKNTAGIVTDGEWKHIAVVYTKNEILVYEDGNLKNTVENSEKLTDILGGQSIFQIGKANWKNGEYYQGLLDDYAVYNYALTETEIKALSKTNKERYIVSEDAHIQSWKTEKDRNYGDSIYLAVKKAGDGVLGERGNNSVEDDTDAKLVLLKFDLSEIAKRKGSYDKAELSLTYIVHREEQDSGQEDCINVAAVEGDWNEIALTWNSRPDFTVEQESVKSSETYVLENAFQDRPQDSYAFRGRKVNIDITELLNEAINEGKDTLTLAVNEANGWEHYFVSKEGALGTDGNGEGKYARATEKMAPSILLNIPQEEEPVPDPIQISGPRNLTLVEGYEATETGSYTIAGGTSPAVTLAGDTAGGKISWDGESKKLKIAAGIPEGDYTVKIQVKEDGSAEVSAECQFTLKVTKKQGGDQPTSITISGPQNLTLVEGYEATETGIYTIAGGTSPAVTLAGDTAGGKISWDGESRKLKIAGGIPEGEYTVKIQVKENGSAEQAAECEFKLTVTKEQGGDQPTSITISGPKDLTLEEGYQATETGSYTITGGTSPVVTLAGNTADGKISWDGESRKLKIAGGIPEGEYTVKIQVKEDGSAGQPAECEFKLTVTKKGLEIEDEGNGNYQVKIPETAPGQDKPISISLPKALAESIKNSQAEQISLNVKIPGNVAGDRIEAIAIPKEVLEAVKEAGKDLTIAVDGSISYQWAFSAENLASAQIDDLNLALEVDSEKDAEIKNLLNEGEQGMVVSFAQQGEIHGAKVTIDASKMGWKAGETVTLGYYNPEKKELETVGAYSVGEDGKVAIDPAKGGKYVLWKKTGSGTAVPVDSVELNKTKLTLNVKEAYTLKATIKPDGAASTGLAWKSEDERIAYVDQKGVVTGKKAGKTKIIVTAGDKTATCTVTVKVPVSKVTLNKTKLTMGVKETFSLKATVKPGNATNKTVEWKSSNKKTVEVKKGKLSAKKKGTATITATVDGRKVTCKVTVKPAPTKKAKVTLNAKSVKLKLKGKKTFQIKPKVSSKFGSASFQYTVDKKGRKVVKVDKNGKVTARKKGKATITVKTYNKKGNAKLKVTVK